MTPERLAILIFAELNSAGYVIARYDNPTERIPLNEPTTIAGKAIRDRIDYGDVTCAPDADEIRESHDG